MERHSADLMVATFELDRRATDLYDQIALEVAGQQNADRALYKREQAEANATMVRSMTELLPRVDSSARSIVVDGEKTFRHVQATTVWLAGDAKFDPYYLIGTSGSNTKKSPARLLLAHTTTTGQCNLRMARVPDPVREWIDGHYEEKKTAIISETVLGASLTSDGRRFVVTHDKSDNILLDFRSSKFYAKQNAKYFGDRYWWDRGTKRKRATYDSYPLAWHSLTDRVMYVEFDTLRLLNRLATCFGLTPEFESAAATRRLSSRIPPGEEELYSPLYEQLSIDGIK